MSIIIKIIRKIWFIFMNSLFLKTFFSVCLSGVFASPLLFSPIEEISPPSKAQMDSVALSPLTSSCVYFTLGSSVGRQQVGVGLRYQDCEALIGHDINLNANVSLPLLLLRDPLKLHIDYLCGVLPGIRYSCLSYNAKNPSAYFGVCCEVVVNVSTVLGLGTDNLFFPSCGLIWGKEREDMRFSQIQVNLFPVIGILGGVIGVIEGDGLGLLAVLVLSPFVVEYSVAW